MCVVTGTDAPQAGILQRMPPQSPEQPTGRTMVLAQGTDRPLPPLSGRATFRAAKLIKIKAKQGSRCSDTAEERFISGGLMPMRPQSKTLMTSPALRLAVAVLALFFLVAVGAKAAIQAAPDHFTAQSAVDIGFLDCPSTETASGHAHCQSPTYATVETHLPVSPPEPASGSDVWVDAAATSNATPINLRLFRPPKFFRAQV